MNRRPERNEASCLALQSHARDDPNQRFCRRFSRTTRRAKLTDSAPEPVQWKHHLLLNPSKYGSRFVAGCFAAGSPARPTGWFASSLSTCSQSPPPPRLSLLLEFLCVQTTRALAAIAQLDLAVCCRRKTSQSPLSPCYSTVQDLSRLRQMLGKWNAWVAPFSVRRVSLDAH